MLNATQTFTREDRDGFDATFNEGDEVPVTTFDPDVYPGLIEKGLIVDSARIEENKEEKKGKSKGKETVTAEPAVVEDGAE